MEKEGSSFRPLEQRTLALSFWQKELLFQCGQSDTFKFHDTNLNGESEKTDECSSGISEGPLDGSRPGSAFYDEVDSSGRNPETQDLNLFPLGSLVLKSNDNRYFLSLIHI
eukprot:TRINITY_DN12985_c0_g1_i2.p1 TRINITY_DN12985_c0_g1~~TRINITY_DN12985_c0_g1_i2.p1  ORF type:complete len:111 (+),score=29.54 TRINITY_DN12985_c0_g1_i2:155-487(+)